MIEEALFENPSFRANLAANGLGILMMFSGHDATNGSYLDIFLNPDYPNGTENPRSAGADLQSILTTLAAASGYPEVQYAPLMPVGHSSAGSFVWHLYRWDPSRIFAMLPFKTGAKTDGPQGIPIMMVESEWFDYGSSTNVTWSNLGLKLGARANGSDSLFGYYVDFGSGHENVSDDSIDRVNLFVTKAVAARIPTTAPINAPVPLNPVAISSGWLLDSARFGLPSGQAVAYDSYTGDKQKAWWYLDQELAQSIQDHMVAQLAKKSQQLGLVVGGVAQTAGGTPAWTPAFQSDGATFQLQAAYVDHLDTATSNLFPPGTLLTHASSPIFYRAANNSGVVQVGPDTFRVRLRDGPTAPQGNPWEPTLVAYSVGDSTYQPTERPVHVNISVVNTAGKAQTIIFPTIADRKVANLAAIPLTASASSGLPVHYFIVAGPARLQNDTLVFDQVPVNARLPMTVEVAAFQWGRQIAPQVQTAPVVVQRFSIQ